ncbi:MAG: pathogenesis-related transcriptional factor and ERF protein [Planctomycetota bacterium]|nr:MAG: pathogenesis-related transcriptional factor and ERF protein [Planctomycetota bacterium]
MPRKVKGYSRVDTGEAHGWLVRIKRGDERRSKFISDKSAGGKKKAENAAKALYEQWTKELPPPETAEGKLGKRNKTGVVGVHFSSDADSRYPNCVYEYYIASWKSADGQRQNARFSVSRWGKKVALELAKLAREKKIADRDKIIQLYEQEHGPIKEKKVARRNAAGTKKAAAKKTTKKAAAKKKTAKKAAAKKTVKKAAKKKTAKKKPAARKK